MRHPCLFVNIDNQATGAQVSVQTWGYHTVCPEGKGHSWQPNKPVKSWGPAPPKPPLEPGKCQGQNQGSYPMLKGSHEMAAALLPIWILYPSNLLDDFGEDALSQLQEIRIQGKKNRLVHCQYHPTLRWIPHSPTIPTTKQCHNTATATTFLIFRPSTCLSRADDSINVAPQDSASFFPSTAWTSLEANLGHENEGQQWPHVLCKIFTGA